MSNSNYTLRFPRTSREAFGSPAVFDSYDSADRWVFIFAVIAAVFVIGLLIGRMAQGGL